MNGKAVAALIAALLAGSALAFAIGAGDDDEQAVETVTIPVTQEAPATAPTTVDTEPDAEPDEEDPAEEPPAAEPEPVEPSVTTGRGGGVEAP